MDDKARMPLKDLARASRTLSWRRSDNSPVMSTASSPHLTPSEESGMPNLKRERAVHSEFQKVIPFIGMFLRKAPASGPWS